MSLKAFHLVFIAASALLAFGAGFWGVSAHPAQGETMYFTLGLFSFGAGVLLVVYGLRFYKKLGHLR